jgi:general secretion pathway protein H
MSVAGSDGGAIRGDSGFTLFEVLAVMAIVAMIAAALSTLYRSPSAGVEVRAEALLAASRLRDLRASAMAAGRERLATIDAASRVIRFNDGRDPLVLGRSIVVAVTAAESEQRSPTTAGIRFFPNGSSSGATIKLSTKRHASEIRVNWLTGRVSTDALD